jgi:hypothetical protein
MGIKVKCDSCGALLDTKVENGAEARYIAKKAGWISEDGLTGPDEGKDFCPNCNDASAVEQKSQQ